VIKEYFNSSMKVVYEFLGGKKWVNVAMSQLAN
jgi:hypothetical protein